MTVVSVQPGLGMGFTPMTPSGIFTRIAVVAVPSQPCGTPTVAAPSMYIFLRPIRSEMWPNSGIETNDTRLGILETPIFRKLVTEQKIERVPIP